MDENTSSLRLIVFIFWSTEPPTGNPGVKLKPVFVKGIIWKTYLLRRVSEEAEENKIK